MTEASIAIGVLYACFLRALGFTRHRVSCTSDAQYTIMSRHTLHSVLLECNLVKHSSSEEEVARVVDRLIDEQVLRRGSRDDTWRLTANGIHAYHTHPEHELHLRAPHSAHSPLQFATAE